MLHIAPGRFRFLMRRHRWTIRTLAKAVGVTHDRVRELRQYGLAPRGKPDASAYFDATCWLENLTGRVSFDRGRYEALKARAA